MSNLDKIVGFLKGKGLSSFAIAGIVGNLQVESGFRPNASNSKEGAIGIGQWEGGRRTLLQNYAAKHGGSEGNLDTQLNFMWAELNGGYKSALSGITGATSASQAAAIWDEQYEHSAGTSRGARVSAAEQYYSTGKISGIPTYTTLGGGGAVEESAAGGGTPSGTPETVASFGDMGSLAETVPALKTLLNQAVAGQWTVEKFQQEVQGTAWYKAHATSVRDALTLQASDPATYNQNLSQAVAHVKQLAEGEGVNLTDAQLRSMGYASMTQGLDDTTISDQIGSYFKADNGLGGTAAGSAATNLTAMQQAASSYGVPVSANGYAVWNQKILSGQNTLDGFTQQMIKNAQTIYPGIKNEIGEGNTVQQIADPYVQTMSNLLEVSPNSLSITNTPLIKQALQNTSPTTDGSGSGAAASNTATPLWQFENQVRADPRWAYTSNAHQATATTLLQLGSDFGFEG